MAEFFNPSLAALHSRVLMSGWEEIPAGGAAARTLHIDNDGKIDLGRLAPGSYWLEVIPPRKEQNGANGDAL
jgi:hypothetical protein